MRPTPVNCFTLVGQMGSDNANRDGELPICRTAANSEELQGPPRQLKIAWNANAACTVAAPVAKERGIFAKHNLDVDFVNFGGSTDQLLEAIATGKGSRCRYWTASACRSAAASSSLSWGRVGAENRPCCGWSRGSTRRPPAPC